MGRRKKIAEGNFNDGILSLNNNLVNKRNILFNSRLISRKLSITELQEAYKTGIVNKIIRLKTSPLLDNTLLFKDSQQKEFYENKLEFPVKETLKFMLGFGRGILVLHFLGDDLNKPFVLKNKNELIIRSFSGDMISDPVVNLDLNSVNYLKPDFFVVRGFPIHNSRVIDFSYVKPPEYQLPNYFYGGISETELIYNQLVNDGVVERATANIIEKSSNFVYQMLGFKTALQTNNNGELIKYFSALEDLRQIQGAIVIDKEDDVKEVSQNLTNLSDADTITIRRIAMVTGIPVSILIGENVKGLNSSGENEIKTYNDMIRNLQHDYVKNPLNNLFSKLDFEPITFAENQGLTPNDKIIYEQKVLDNALKLQQLGEDFNKYLEDKGIIEPSNWETYWQKDTQDSSKGFFKKLFKK